MTWLLAACEVALALDTPLDSPMCNNADLHTWHKRDVKDAACNKLDILPISIKFFKLHL